MPFPNFPKLHSFFNISHKKEKRERRIVKRRDREKCVLRRKEKIDRESLEICKEKVIGENYHSNILIP